MWTVFIIVLLVVVVAFLFIRKTKKKEVKPDVYVCDVCGEKDCICHKEDRDA